MLRSIAWSGVVAGCVLGGCGHAPALASVSASASGSDSVSASVSASASASASGSASASAPAPAPALACADHRPAALWTSRPGEPATGNHCADLAACVASCTRGVTAACIDAGNALARAHRELPRQLDLYTRACELGDALGCTNLGATLMIDDAKSKPERFRCAARLFVDACRVDEPIGCSMEGYLLATGDGVPADVALARATFARGCNAQLAAQPELALSVQQACSAYVDTIASGKLGPPDPAAVHGALAIGCAAGDTDACAAAH